MSTIKVPEPLEPPRADCSASVCDEAATLTVDQVMADSGLLARLLSALPHTQAEPLPPGASATPAHL